MSHPRRRAESQAIPPSLGYTFGYIFLPCRHVWPLPCLGYPSTGTTPRRGRTTDRGQFWGRMTTLPRTFPASSICIAVLAWSRGYVSARVGTSRPDWRCSVSCSRSLAFLGHQQGEALGNEQRDDGSSELSAHAGDVAGVVAALGWGLAAVGADHGAGVRERPALQIQVEVPLVHGVAEGATVHGIADELDADLLQLVLEKFRRHHVGRKRAEDRLGDAQPRAVLLPDTVAARLPARGVQGRGGGIDVVAGQALGGLTWAHVGQGVLVELLRGRTESAIDDGTELPEAYADARGVDEIYLLAVGYPCAGPPPTSALGVGLTALNLLLHRQLADEVRAYAGRARLHVVPPRCPLTTSPADFAQAESLMERARRATGDWLESPPDAASGRTVPRHSATMGTP